MEKLQNIGKTIKEYGLIGLRFGKRVLYALLLVAFFVSLLVGATFIAVGLLTIPVVVTLLITNLLGLSGAWAVIIFFALICLMLC